MRTAFCLAQLTLFVGLVVSSSLRPAFISLGEYLVVSDRLEKADAILLLGGGALHRGREAAWLFHAGYAPLIAVMGDGVPPDIAAAGLDLNEWEVGRRQLLANGVPARAIEHLPGIDTSTCEEGRLCAGVARQRGWRRVIVVTSKFHTRRAKLIFRKAMRGLGVKVIVRPAAGDPFDPTRWWTREKSLLDLNNEYCKLLRDALRRCL